MSAGQWAAAAVVVASDPWLTLSDDDRALVAAVGHDVNETLAGAA